MRRCVNGKVYDTETAEWLASCDYTYEKGMGCYYQEVLYRRRNGTFFFHRLFYGVKPGGIRCEVALKEEIVPISIHEAVWWGEDVLLTEDYERIFNTV